MAAAAERKAPQIKGEKLMFRRKFGHLMVASAFVLALTGASATSAFAFHTENPTPGSDLAADVQTAERGEKTVANDTDTAAEMDVDDGQVEDVDEATVTGPSNS
jgi:hypothetical protein